MGLSGLKVRVPLAEQRLKGALWEIRIAEFDADLAHRMKIIQAHELVGFNFDSSLFVRRVLGFPNRRLFPWWRDYQAAWISRNRDRRNERKRLRYRQRCKLGLKTQYHSSPEARKRADKKYKKLHREEINLRVNNRRVLRGGVLCGEEREEARRRVRTEHTPLLE